MLLDGGSGAGGWGRCGKVSGGGAVGLLNITWVSVVVRSGGGMIWSLNLTWRSVVGWPLYMAGLGFHPKGMKLRGNSRPIGLRGTILPLASKNWV